MEIKLVSGDITRMPNQTLIVNYYESSDKLEGDAALVDKALEGAISRLICQGEIKGKYKEITTIYTLGKLAGAKVVVLGLGKKNELTAEKIRVALAGVCKALCQKKSESNRTVSYSADLGGFEAQPAGQSITEGILLGTYTFRKYMTKAQEQGEIKQLDIIYNRDNQNEMEKGIQRGKILAEAAMMARDYVNEPANLMTPTALAAKAQELAENYSLEIKVLERDQMQESGMGGLLGVAQGSNQHPKFIVLNYKGKNSDDLDIALIGKGITFDSGGISIKPAEGMGDMKGDMAGGASVMGASCAIALLKPRINVSAIIPATENLPSGTAMRPGDVITIGNGKTVEIITTDAEGRLILADSLSYAKKMGARRLIDVATLTGSCHIALGDVCTGIFSNNQELAREVIAAGDSTGECMWQMPMNEEYRDLNKSDVADLKNSGGRYGGAISAAWFLREFAEDTPWVHLDIAGTSDINKDRGYLVKGGTGIPVRTLINLVLKLAEEKE